MNTQNLSEDIQTKSGFFSGKGGRRLIIILCCIASIAVFAVSLWLYPSPQTLPAPVATEPIGWTEQDAVAKAALVESVATRSTQPLSAQDVKVKQNILQAINRK